jgi:hypothetical protein
MSTASPLPIACVGVGSTLNNLSCCYANNQASTACQNIFSGTNSVLSRGCKNTSRDCVTDCANEGLLYTSLVQDDRTGNGRGPISRYQACVNLPSIARFSEFGQLSPDLFTHADRYIAPNNTDSQLQGITSAVTDCLSSTCRNSRRSDLCYDNYCSPVKLLANSSSPNITAVNQCLHTLCSGGYNSLPFADADIVGVGVQYTICVCSERDANRDRSMRLTYSSVYSLPSFASVFSFPSYGDSCALGLSDKQTVQLNGQNTKNHP